MSAIRGKRTCYTTNRKSFPYRMHRRLILIKPGIIIRLRLELISTSIITFINVQKHLITINLIAEMGDIRICFPEKVKQVQIQILVIGGPPEHNVNAVGMSKFHRQIIRRNRDNIVTNISTSIDSIIDAMFSQGVITYDHKVQLYGSTVPNPYIRVRNFLDILCERGSKAFEQFCITVRRFHSELADDLERQAGLSSSAANFNSGS
ncbi:uncharacterized protein TRIADDRAFT_63599 [Trichoplax adhaerens]|uniref:Expressed protein n=1 Tax=Trichoplax adhaerens TaxID=10228 RepID=B3RMP9_TRIAD|nr:expressed protein [Trichoplax adhaerens]EDV27313.1 expressed protein [Trichoplax adhaerens]|eukprot:XP_002109147.1 expressed protein [Trichoplax adhaerens]